MIWNVLKIYKVTQKGYRLPDSDMRWNIQFSVKRHELILHTIKFSVILSIQVIWLSKLKPVVKIQIRKVHDKKYGTNT